MAVRIALIRHFSEIQTSWKEWPWSETEYPAKTCIEPRHLLWYIQLLLLFGSFPPNRCTPYLLPSVTPYLLNSDTWHCKSLAHKWKFVHYTFLCIMSYPGKWVYGKVTWPCGTVSWLSQCFWHVTHKAEWFNLAESRWIFCKNDSAGSINCGVSHVSEGSKPASHRPLLW